MLIQTWETRVGGVQRGCTGSFCRVERKRSVPVHQRDQILVAPDGDGADRGGDREAYLGGMLVPTTAGMMYHTSKWDTPPPAKHSMLAAQ